MKNIKKILMFALSLTFLLTAVSCGYQGGAQNSEKTAVNSTAASSAAGSDDYVVTNTVEIKVKDMGTITVELYGELAPITVDNFISLVNQKFYDGLTFHRIISGFMVQGGAASADSTVTPDTIKGEFSANGVENDLSHTRGVISMARAGYSYDSATSQFFIMHADTPSLDGQYAAFGRVISGIEVVDELAKTPVTDSNGTVAEANQPVIESIREVK